MEARSHLTLSWDTWFCLYDLSYSSLLFRRQNNNDRFLINSILCGKNLIFENQEVFTADSLLTKWFVLQNGSLN